MRITFLEGVPHSIKDFLEVLDHSIKLTCKVLLQLFYDWLELLFKVNLEDLFLRLYWMNHVLFDEVSVLFTCIDEPLHRLFHVSHFTELCFEIALPLPPLFSSARFQLWRGTVYKDVKEVLWFSFSSDLLLKILVFDAFLCRLRLHHFESQKLYSSIN